MRMNLITATLASCFLIFGHSHAQTKAADNKPYQSPTRQAIPVGVGVFGVFEGRPPCQEIARQMDSVVRPECIKVKWRLILYQDPASKRPTTYKLYGALLPTVGNWSLVRGMPGDANAELVQIEAGKGGKFFYLLKGDDNVLFILDEKRNFRTGDDYLSYTLNRVELIAATQ